MNANISKLLLAPLLLIGCTASVSTEDAERLAVANEVVDAWNNMDWQRAFDTFAEDGVLHSMMAQPFVGREAISERLYAVVDGLDRIELEVVNMGVINDVVVLERVDDLVYKGKHSRIPVVGVMEISNGKVDEWREYYDKATLMAALTAETDPSSSLASRTASERILALTKQLSEDWNRGDMTAYLDRYVQDEAMAIVFSNQVVAGFEGMQRMFTSTWSTEEQMGDFETSGVNVRLIGPGLAMANGQFEHQFTDEKVIGAFSHVWRQGADGDWKILHEHTSRGHVE